LKNVSWLSLVESSVDDSFYDLLGLFVIIAIIAVFHQNLDWQNLDSQYLDHQN